VGLRRLALRARGLGKFMNKEKNTFAKVTLAREDIASIRVAFSKEEYERLLLEWWANYDPGMDAYLLSRTQTSNPNSLCEAEAPRLYEEGKWVEKED
jgi:hypothetical protein